MPDYTFPNPFAGVSVGQSLYEQLLESARLQQQMEDFYARREALRALGEAPIVGLEDLRRPEAIRQLYRTVPEEAFALEQTLYRPELEARKAAAMEAAKQQARLAAEVDAIQRLRGLAPAGAVATSRGPWTDMTEELAVGPQGLSYKQSIPSAADVRRKEEELALAREKAQREEKELALASEKAQREAQAAIEQSWRQAMEDYHKGLISADDLLRRQALIGSRQPMTAWPSASASAAAAPGGAGLVSGSAPWPSLPKTQEQLTLEKEQREEQRKREAEERALAQKLAAEQREEQRKREAEQRQDQREKVKEQRLAYQKEIFEPLNAALTERRALAASKLDRLIQMNNTGKFGKPIFSVLGLSEVLGATDAEANEFQQGFSSLLQSFIQPGTSGSANTVAEMSILQRGLGGLGGTPRGNAQTLLALRNGVERLRHQQEFFRTLQQRGVHLEDARIAWQQYVDQNAPFIISGDYTIVRNPDFIPVSKWLAYTQVVRKQQGLFGKTKDGSWVKLR